MKQADGIDGCDAPPRLLIADEDPAARAKLSSELSAFRVVGLATDATEAVELARRHRPDLALIDVEMPGGCEAVRAIASCSPRTSMVILSADETHSAVVELLNAGAFACQRKGTPAAALSLVLHNALRVKDAVVGELAEGLTAALHAHSSQTEDAVVSVRGSAPAPSSTTAT
jgi:DNA-binding NarL/FixJ family response regulator